jgi:UDP-N-acetylglucosamine--N-acetylmuramyl-(pentapeptide) pyrophosphoryl-undecaprenol N-acetylglucosamine transferase
MEQDLVPKSGIAMDSINFTGMRGKGLKHTVSGAFKMVKAFADCFSFIGRRKPDVVMGMGGYVTVPGGLMARLRGTPLVLVNADAALLLSNKTLVPAAARVLRLPANFGNAASKAVVTGNPVRKEILDMASPAQRFAGRAARCASWWWAAAWARRRSTMRCLRRWR